MTNKNAAFAGAGLLAAGLFCPIVTMPVVGSINLFNNGTNLVGIALLMLAGIGAGLAARDRISDAIWPGLAACGVLLYLFGSLQFRLSQMRASVAKEMDGHPFAGLAQTALGAIQLQWGWLVLAAGAGLLVYAGLSARRQEEARIFALNDTTSRAIAGLSLLLLLFAPAWDLWSRAPSGSSAVIAKAPGTIDTNATDATAMPGNEARPSAEEAAYIRQNLRLYDFHAKYYDSLLEGRVPGVDFKIQNNGNRTLNKVTVRVVFYDAQGNSIAEEEYSPVMVSEYSYGGDNTPLRPHYIWQQEADKFWQAKNVPSEWAPGKASATITDVEFGPNG